MAIALSIALLGLLMPASTYPIAAGGGKPGGGGGGGGSTTGADVSITLTDSPDPIEVGGDLTYKATAKNSGPQTATGVTVTDELPAAVEFLSASSTKGSCTGTATVTCNLGDLAKRATATVTIVVRPVQAGTIANRVTVGATQSDPKNANNSATTSTTVTGSPSPSPTPTTSPTPTSSPAPTTSPSPTASPTPTISPTPPSGSGVLDASFGTGGKVITDFGREREKAQAIAIQPDGKIVVGGCAHAPSNGDCRTLYTVGSAYHFTLARYTSEGVLDASFGDNGQVVTAFGDEIGEWAHGVADLAIRSDGKIVAVGTATKCPVRIDAPSACPLGGWRGLALARYESDGTLDPTFGRMGTVIANPQPHGWGAFNANAMALQADGKIIVVGTTCCPIDFLVARFLENGLPDPTFGGDGVVTTAWVPEWDVADAVVVQEDGKIIAGGWSDGRTCACGSSPPINFDFALARYNFDGTLDASFGDGGKVLTDFGAHERMSNMAISGSGADAQLVAVGNAILARYNLVDGSLDQSFGDSGTGAVTTPSLGAFHDKIGIAFDAAGRIVLAGDSGTDFALLRYADNGALDTSFGTRGTVLTDFGGDDGAADVVVQSDGRIIVVGPTEADGAGDFALARYLP